MSRFWFWLWLQPAVMAVLLLFVIYTLIAFGAEELDLPLLSIQFMVQGGFIFPGLILSLGVNQAILWVRKPRTITRAEKIVIGILVGLIALFIALSFVEELFGVFFFTWPLLVVYAIVVTVVLAATSAKLRRTETEPSADAALDELFAGGED